MPSSPLPDPDLGPFGAVLALPPLERESREQSLHPTARFTPDRVERFVARIDRSGGPDACWPYLGKLWTNEYALVRFGPRSSLGHRAAYALAVGVLPLRPMVIRHLCGNRRCLNPAHLAVGSAADNAADALRHGTFPRGPRRVRRGEEEADRILVMRLVDAHRREGAPLVQALAPVAELLGISRGHADKLYHRARREREARMREPVPPSASRGGGLAASARQRVTRVVMVVAPSDGIQND